MQVKPPPVPKFGKKLLWGWVAAAVILFGSTFAAAIPQTQSLSSAAGRILELPVLLGILLGSSIGVVVGALPGITPVTALAVMMPLTFGWDTNMAMYFLISIAGGAMFAGSVPSILIGVPGDPPNAPVCFDGYPMTKRGEGGRALGAAAMADMCGTIVGITVLIILLPFVRALILSFSAPEFFWLMIAAIVAVAFAIRTNMLKGLFAGGMGLLASMVGFSSVLSQNRFASDSYFLYDGFELAPLVTGIFALSTMYELQLEGEGQTIKVVTGKLTGVTRGILDVFRYPVSFIRSSLIGIIVGILPGVGGTAAAFVCYGTAVQASKHPETFGKGDVEGVIAPQFGIAAERGGAILPTVAFGIPGSTLMALMLGAFILHGIVPGPLLVRDHLDLVWALIWGLGISAIGSAILGMFMAPMMAKIAEVKNYYLVPIVVVLCLSAAYAIRGSFYDMFVMFLAGAFGFGLSSFGFPLICFCMGFILGAGTETDFHQTLMISYGSFAPFFTRPIAGIEFLLVLLLVTFPFVQNILGRGKKPTGKMKDGLEITK